MVKLIAAAKDMGLLLGGISKLRSSWLLRLCVIDRPADHRQQFSVLGLVDMYISMDAPCAQHLAVVQPQDNLVAFAIFGPPLQESFADINGLAD